MTLEELSEVMAYMRPTHPQRSEYQRHFAKKRRVFMLPFWRRWHDWADAHTISTSTTARAHDDHVLREAVLKGWKLHTQSPKASPRKAPREAELALGSCAAAGANPVGTVALSKVSDRPKQAADAPRGVSTPRSQAKPKHRNELSTPRYCNPLRKTPRVTVPRRSDATGGAAGQLPHAPVASIVRDISTRKSCVGGRASGEKAEVERQEETEGEPERAETRALRARGRTAQDDAIWSVIDRHTVMPPRCVDLY